MVHVLGRWLKQHGLGNLLAQVTRTNEVYEMSRCALAAVNGKVRGRALEIAARERDRLLHPSCRVVGAQDELKLPGDAPFDWLRVDSNGVHTRVEHKSAQLAWSTYDNRWQASFQDIKARQYDELHLSLFTPPAIFCFTQREEAWPLMGKKYGPHGRNIRLQGSRGELDIEVALNAILTKIGARSLVCSYPHDDPVLSRATFLAVSRTYGVYMSRGCPLSSLSFTCRGMLLETIARMRDAERHPQCRVEHADGCLGIGGRRLHGAIRKHDWKRVRVSCGAETRVEHKSAQISWDSSNICWRIQWRAVEQESYDELQLTVYAPRELRIFIHDGMTGLAGKGSSRSIQISGPRNEFDFDLSMAVILEKIIAAFGSPVMQLS